MKLNLSLQWKLTISFILIVAFVILFVYLLSNYYIIRHFEFFCEAYGSELPKCLSDQAGQRFLTAINKTLVWIGSIGFLLALFFGYFASRFFLKPIDKVISAVKSFSKGNYQTRIDLQTDKEIRELIESLNEMFQSLEKSEQLRKDLTANISHELATPLTNIYGYIEALKDGLISSKKEKSKTLNIIKKETERLIKLTRELKSLALLESDNFRSSREKTDVNKLIESTLENFKMKIKKKKIKLKKNLNSDLPQIKIDSCKFQQALSNVIDNAIYYSYPEGKIEIETGLKEGNAIISIKDFGKGIKKEDLPFIFERFYQGNKSRSGRGGNIGIGLTIVKKIIESHQGKIEVFSQKNRGSKFIISIPIK
ncbi:MAG: sensor histidine kinase [Patescibacteria group bacterium]